MSAFSVCASCLAIMLSSHLSRPVQVSVRPAYIIDRRAAPAVLTVQSVPIEEDEVRPGNSVDHFVDAKKVLDRSSCAAFRARVERSDAGNAHRCITRAVASAPLGGSSRCGLAAATLCCLRRLRRLGKRPRPHTDLCLRSRTRRRTSARGTLRFRPVCAGRPTRIAPPMLDFRHATTDNELQM